MKSRLSLEGGVPLKGTVRSSGAKNAALPILAGCILTHGDSVIHNVPDLMDIKTMIKMLEALGLKTDYRSNGTLRVSSTQKIRHIAPYELVTAMRASFFVAGPVLAKTGLAKIPLPGGCAIGSRPIDLHLKGFEALGATTEIQHGFVVMKAKKLVGTQIYLDFPSVGATENIMMAACLAEGKTVIENAALEPEITDLGEFLNSAGARISGLRTNKITIEGVSQINNTEYTVIPDRIEVGTLMIAAAITLGDIVVEGIRMEHQEPLIQKLRDCGAVVEIGDDTIRVSATERVRAVDIKTMPFPGFPTDMQAQFLALLTVANGTSVVTETIFENRFMHAQELIRMGAKIKIEQNHVTITGVEQLSGADVKITDLRAGAALILAGLAADGFTTVHGLHHLNRGYENLPAKIRSLGGRISG